ncbi:hypothetical protein D9757_009681 [Collybiopsis confluens]|uniref:Uncharacterized protein n=1 Tax=Collybiopsis confluens TaxID=2823264 RepID=A0A8H5H266_9AGAR|nr:hypothetical protein D9757_009681 [Collybiopsis confluens]
MHILMHITAFREIFDSSVPPLTKSHIPSFERSMASLVDEFDSLNEIEEYVQSLLPQKRGYPLWSPKPGDWLPPAFREEGVRIGDVGIVTEMGQFDYLFNTCLPADDPVNQGRVPHDFKQLQGVDIHDTVWSQEFGPGSVVASNSSSVERSEQGGNSGASGVPEELGTGLSLRSPSTSGALLILPEGGKSTNSQHLIKFRQHAAECAKSWYDFVNGPLARGVHNDAIYLVTGCDMTRAWGVASFTDAPPDSVSLDFGPRVRNGNYEYWFRTSDFAASSSGTSHERKQSGCVFLRGFKLAIRSAPFTPSHSRFSVSYISKFTAHGLSPSRVIHSPAIMWQWLSHYVRLSVFSRVPPEPQASLDAPDYVNEPDYTTCKLFHPSDAINQYILSEHEEVNVAITHDDDWAFVVRDDEEDIPDDQELFNRIRNFLKISRLGQYAFAYFALESASISSDTNRADISSAMEDDDPSMYQ